jgi:hypothetical protein
VICFLKLETAVIQKNQISIQQWFELGNVKQLNELEGKVLGGHVVDAMHADALTGERCGSHTWCL